MCLTERVKQGRRHPEKKIPSLLKKRLDGLVLKGEPSRGNFCPLILVLLMKQIFILLPLDNPSDIQNMSWSPVHLLWLKSYGSATSSGKFLTEALVSLSDICESGKSKH